MAVNKRYKKDDAMKQKVDSKTSNVSTDIYRIYDFNPMLAKTEQKEQDRIDAIDALVMTDEFQYRADSGTLSGMSLDKMVINAACSYYPNPADMDNRKTAFTLFRDVLLKIINYYRKRIFNDPVISTPDDMDGSKYKPITKIAPYFVVETLFGFYDIYNATYSEADILEGAFVCQSKDEEQDPLGKFRPLDQIVALFKSELLTPEVSVKNLASSIKI